MPWTVNGGSGWPCSFAASAMAFNQDFCWGSSVVVFIGRPIASWHITVGHLFHLLPNRLDVEAVVLRALPLASSADAALRQ
jgi:hypothetical protein